MHTCSQPCAVSRCGTWWWPLTIMSCCLWARRALSRCAAWGQCRALALRVAPPLPVKVEGSAPVRKVGSIAGPAAMLIPVAFPLASLAGVAVWSALQALWVLLPPASLKCSLLPVPAKLGQGAYAGGRPAQAPRYSYRSQSQLYDIELTLLQSVQGWVRARTQEAGLPRPREVHAVSSMKDTGVRDLLSSLHRAAGGRGDVWVVRSSVVFQGAGSLSCTESRAAYQNFCKQHEHVHVRPAGVPALCRWQQKRQVFGAPCIAAPCSAVRSL